MHSDGAVPDQCSILGSGEHAVILLQDAGLSSFHTPLRSTCSVLVYRYARWVPCYGQPPLE